MSSSKTLVTGGAGLIGSSLVEKLVAHGKDVVIVDDFSRGRPENLARVIDQIELRQGNLEDPAFASRALRDPVDTVFHLASRAMGVAYSKNRHLQILHHNEAVTHNLLSALSANPPRRICVTSSSCVYPDNGPDVIPELPPFTGEPEQVNRGYGWSKRFLEQKATLFAADSGSALSIVRPFNVFGERYHWAGEFSQAIPMLVKRVLDGEDPVVVWGSGQQRRSYIHAIDCARMMLALVTADHHSGPINLGTSETVSIVELVSRIGRAAGHAPHVEPDPSRPEGRFVKSADMARFHSLVPGFKFEIQLDEGLRRMVEWYHRTDFSTVTA